MPLLNSPNLLQTIASVQFVLQNKIGGGGEAEVFTAIDTQLNAQIVIKRIPVGRFNNQIDFFFAESQKLYLTRHHNIVEIYYGCQDQDHVYLAMPHYSRGSIRNLTDQRFLTAREIVRYSLQFLSGLNNVHSKRLIHFDIKTENILLSEKNQAVLSDFGLAGYTSQYGFSAIAGTTPVYAPPEYFSQGQHNVAFDIYQAGLTMYRMAVGDAFLDPQYRRYFDVNGNFVNDGRLAADSLCGAYPDRTFPLHIPKQLKSVIVRAMEPNPDDRYKTVIDMLNDLSGVDYAHDWNYSVDPATGHHKWQLGNQIMSAASTANGRWNLHGEKNGRRVTAVCQNDLTLGAKNTLIYNKLMNGL